MGIEELKLLRMPRDYKERICNFDENKKEELENYVKSVKIKYNIDINIKWHDKIKGLLKTVSSMPSSGLDFDEEMKRFMFHNIYNKNDAIPLHLIASRYIEIINQTK